MANQTHSLAHTKWMCKYHIVFTPKYRRKAIYGELRKDIREYIRTLCKYKGVVLQYLLKNSDEDNAISGKEIANDIRETYGIEAERRSVYEDIKEINRILLMLKEGCTIFKVV